jgi:peptide chain release factor 3
MKLEVCPLVWPIGDGERFKGVLDRQSRLVHLYERQSRTEKAAEVATVPLDDPDLPVRGTQCRTMMISTSA